jgi:hypothetical protein
MKEPFKGRARRCFVVGWLLLLMIVTSVGYLQAAGLTAEEEHWLTYLREEEKLARDVYVYLYDKYHSPVFYNIYKSEQKHMDAIKTLLDRYGLNDPAAGNDPGVFDNPDLQALYDVLIGQGCVSLVEALKVGVIIEESDIDDLTEGIASTKRKDIMTVYNNLLQGSLNHLDAFCSNLTRFGVTCEP